ncbi:MAG TPA: hypothetical protein VL574_12200 [Stellaceae bacterium]|nr:hypothetical protein [Stellaceae bacterium]
MPELNLDGLARRAPATRVAMIEACLADHHLGLLDLLLGGGEAQEGRHYPAGEAWDATSQAQWFFHAHEAHGGGKLNPMPAECGHFHTFLGSGGMPSGVVPFVLPEMAVAPIVLPVKEKGEPGGTHLSRRDQGRFAHLVGMSIDDAGQPMAVFTTNRWVTGEVWYRAQDLVGALDRFHFQPARPAALDTTGPGVVASDINGPMAQRAIDIVSLWLAGVLAILRPHVAHLLDTRDRTVMDWRRRRTRQTHVFEDRRLDVTSTVLVDFKAELKAALGR